MRKFDTAKQTANQLFMGPKQKLPLIIGHRGASSIAPENTLAAFRLAIESGADGIEFDVRLAKDNVAVVYHDRTLKRTAARAGEMCEYTSDELIQMDVGSWFNKVQPKNSRSEFARQRIPTLAETLFYLKDFRGIIYIELKCKERDVVALSKTVCETLRQSPLRNQVIVKSFKLSVVPQIKSLCPEIRTAALFAPKIMSMLRKEKHLVRLAVEFGADELSLHYSLATRKLMEKAQDRNLPVAIWTADSPRWVQRGINLGLKAIITNNPGRMLLKSTEKLQKK